MIGKGARNQEVIDSMIKNKVVYFAVFFLFIDRRLCYSQYRAREMTERMGRYGIQLEGI